MRLPSGGLLASTAIVATGIALLLSGGASGAREAQTVNLLYDVTLSPGDATARVTWTLTGAHDKILNVFFKTEAHDYTVLEVGNAQGGVLTRRGQDWNLSIDSEEVSVGFVLDVRKGGTKPNEYNSFLSPAWGVVKSEAISVPFDYAFYLPAPNISARVRFTLPPGWEVETPWPRLGATEFQLPFQDPVRGVLPRGYFAVAPQEHFNRTAEMRGDKTFVYVRFGRELEDRAVMFDYLENATKYYASVYGNATGPKILLVSASSPMFHGGLSSTDSSYLHENSTLATIAHEYAHQWQTFQTRNSFGESTLWVNEGDADYHGFLSRMATEFLGLDQLNDELRKEYADRVNDTDFSEPLTRPTYGAPDERVAYRKGMFTLHHLDSELSRRTDGRVTIATVLQRLNAAHVENLSSRPGYKVSNEDFLSLVNEESGLDFSDFFQSYVYGSDYPPFQEVVADQGIAVERLLFAGGIAPDAEAPGPYEVLPDEPLVATVFARNRGIATESKTIALRVDGAPAGTEPIELRVGEAGTVSFPLSFDEPGDYEVTALYVSRIVRILTPANVSISGVETSPTNPMATLPFEVAVHLRNAGEASANATVRVSFENETKQIVVTVRGGLTARASLTFTSPSSGTKPMSVVVEGPFAPRGSNKLVTIAELDTDGDGTPDREDDYPTNPNLQKRDPLSDLRNVTPGPAIAAVVAGAVLATLVGARRKRR